MAKLTEKQKSFCDHLLCDAEQNAEKAYLSAYPLCKKTSAAPAAARLLRNVKVREYLLDAREKRSERTKIDSDWMLTRLANEVDADLADLYDERGALKPIHTWPKIWRQGLVAGVDVEQQYAYEDGQKIPDGVVTKVRLSDRVKRLELVGKHVDVQAFKEKHEHAGPDGGPIQTQNNIMFVGVDERT